MSKWSDEQSIEAGLDVNFSPDSPMRANWAAFVEAAVRDKSGKFPREKTIAIGRAILDLRERAEKAEQERDEAINEVRRLRKESERYMVLVDQAQASNAIADDNFAIERDALKQRCAALEAALRGGIEGMKKWAAMEDNAIPPCAYPHFESMRAVLDIACPGDTSALMEMLEDCGMRSAIACVCASKCHPDGSSTLDENNVRPVVKAIAKRAMEGR